MRDFAWLPSPAWVLPPWRWRLYECDGRLTYPTRYSVQAQWLVRWQVRRLEFLDIDGLVSANTTVETPCATFWRMKSAQRYAETMWVLDQAGNAPR